MQKNDNAQAEQPDGRVFTPTGPLTLTNMLSKLDSDRWHSPGDAARVKFRAEYLAKLFEQATQFGATTFQILDAVGVVMDGQITNRGDMLRSVE